MTDCIKKSIFDLCVVGAGPAGLSASLYGARAGLSVVLFGDAYAGQLARAGIVENFISWPGSPTGLSIIEKMVEQVTSQNVDFRETEIRQIVSTGERLFSIVDNSGNSICSKTVILASGSKHKKLGVKGEEEYYAKGVGYCTICDGPLYKDKPVAIFGFGNSAAQAALRMASLASQVFLLATKPKLGADLELLAELDNQSNLLIVEGVKPKEILGDGEAVSSVVYAYKREEFMKTVSAVFIEVGVLPSTAIASDLGLTLNGQFITVDSTQATNVEGFFAAGDITGGIARQAITSAGDGARAAITAIDYIKRYGLSTKRLKTTQWGGLKGKKASRSVQSPETRLDDTSNELRAYVHKDEGFTNSYNRYNPNMKQIDELKQMMPVCEMLVVSAFWCPDCRRNVPRMAKITDFFPEWKVTVLDRDAEGVREKYSIKKIPTFIILSDSKEVTRIVENPKYESLEHDLLKIAKKMY